MFRRRSPVPLALIGLVLLALVSPPAWVVVLAATLRTTCNDNTGPPFSCTLSGLSAGDLIVGTIRTRDGETPATFETDLSGALTLAVQRGNGVGDYTAIYYDMNASAGDNVVTATFSGGAIGGIMAYAFAGIRTSGALDQTNNAANASGVSHNSGSITTTGAGVIVQHFAFSADHGPTVSDTGFTLNTASVANAVAGYKLSGSTETTNGAVTTTNSVTSNSTIANFLDVAAGATCTGGILTLGAGKAC